MVWAQQHASGQLVLDPLGGAATMALAAQRLGRRWILIESVPEYADLARRRLTEFPAAEPQ